MSLEDHNETSTSSGVQPQPQSNSTDTTSSSIRISTTLTKKQSQDNDERAFISQPQSPPKSSITISSSESTPGTSSSTSLTKHNQSSPKTNSLDDNTEKNILQQSSSSSFSSPLSLISSSQSPVVSSPKGTNNAVTVIQVQSGEINKNEQGASLDTTTEKKDQDDPDGLKITRINVTGESKPKTSSPTPVVVTELETSIIETTNGHHERVEDGGRGSLRLGQSQQGLHVDEDDNQSDISSVVNNPSVISQAPDRYGFMGGEQYTHESEPDPSPEIIRRREMKWLAMMDKWDHYMKKDFKTVRSRCRKGIPRSVRGRAWYYLCGAAYLKQKKPDLFSQLCQQEGKPECIEDIKKDLHRQFPWHEIFAEEGHGQKDLFNVLKAHSILNAKDGYCQAQAPIAAILLMHMPSEDAFWCLVAICDKYLKGYYAPGMEQLQLDGDILFGLLKRVAPPVYKHMKKQKIDPVLYMTEWFLCAFTRTLPWPSVLRMWDSFLCEGVKVLFRVGLVLLKYTLGRTGVLKQCPTMYDTLTMLKNLPNYVTHEQFLVVQVQRLDISDDQMRREHYKHVVKRKKAQQKLEAAKKQQQQQKSSSVDGIRQRVNNISAATIHKSHETAL